ncbi:MAG: DegV family protein [Coriobacteriia bacterium]|nr:DegV family protein [Coriobacteriia bacterium]
MPKVGLVTDSTCDLGPDQLAAMDVTMVPLIVHFGDEGYRDWIEMVPTQFYERLAASAKLPTTSQPSPADFTAAYGREVANGAEEIVVITISSTFSGTFESAMLAAETASVPVRIVDSKLASQATGLVVKAAVEARSQGKTAEEIEAVALKVARSTRLFFVLDTLDNLVKGGRAGKAAGLAAALLNIKPVLRVNSDGIIEPFKKVRGRPQAIAALAQHIAEDSKANGHMRVAMLHGCCDDSAQELEDAITAAGADVEYDSHGLIGSVIGVHTGQRTVGAAYYPVG